MAGIGSKPGVRQGGRQKGTPNKIGATVRENVIRVFDNMGGIKSMTTWAKDNQTEFFKLYGRLIPSETNATLANADGSPLLKGITVVFQSGSEVPPKA